MGTTPVCATTNGVEPGTPFHQGGPVPQGATRNGVEPGDGWRNAVRGSTVRLGRQRRRLSLHIKSVVHVGASLFILKRPPYVKRARAENPPKL